MAQVEIKLEGFEKLRRSMGLTHVRDMLRQEVGKQIHRSAQTLRRNVVRYIDAERHGVPNSPLTVLVKGSSKPLVDRGDLRQGIETDVVFMPNAVVGQVGVSRVAKGKGGKGLSNIAKILHEGTTIKVTPKVRKAVFAKLRQRQGGGVRFDGGGRSAKRTWVIKGRPFVREPYEELEPRILMNIAFGVKKAIDRL